MKKSILSLVILLAVASVALANGEISGKVTKVIDGNTVEIKATDNQVHKVMLVGIDCPELGQEFGDLAKKFLEKIILNKKVTLQFQGKDRWGNYLAIVLIDGDLDPRIELLKEGLAWTAEKNPNEELEPYRTWAQQKSKGLWKQDNPTPPWTYRRQQTMMNAKSS